MKRDRILLFVFLFLSIAINVFIIVQSCFDGVKSTGQSSWVVDMFKNIINTFKKDAINETNIGTFSVWIRKLIGHFGLFVLSGIFTSLFFFFLNKDSKYLLLIICLAVGLIIAVTTEIIQSFLPGRSGEFKDVLIDYGGYLLGSLATYFIAKAVHKKVRINGE